MNKKVKYFLCIALSIVLTTVVVFMPYLYYSANDYSNAYAVTETFSLDRTKDSVSVKEYIDIITNKDQMYMWIDNSSPMHIDELTENIKGAVNFLRMSFEDNKKVLAIIDNFTDSISLLYPCTYEAVSISGSISDRPVSVPLLYIDFYTSDYAYEFSILINRKTNIIYELHYMDPDSIYGEYYSAYDDNAEEAEFYKQTGENLLDYWETADEKMMDLYITPNEFYFNVLPAFYEDYRFNYYDFDNVSDGSIEVN